MNSVIFYALGGLDDGGKNLYCLEINGDIIVIDAGVTFPDKLMRGVDYIIPDYNYLLEHKHQVKGYILTHAHNDQIGALPFFYKDVPAPIYLTTYTKLVLERLTRRHGLNVRYDFRIVNSSDYFEISGHKIHLFQTTHNAPSSFGVAIETPLGNVIYPGNYIVEYNLEKSFMYDLNRLAKLSEKKTLLLLNESIYAERSGYTSPLNRLNKKVTSIFKDHRGRIFTTLFSQNAYNLNEILKLAVANNRKIIFYNKETEERVGLLEQAGDLMILKKYLYSLDDVNRLPEDEVLIIMVLSDAPLFNELIKLAKGQNDDKRISLKPTDAVVVIAPPPISLEKLATEAIDNLYKTGSDITYVTRKELLSLHPSEEDLKMLITLLSPEYYIPIQGDYRSLYANAVLAYNSSDKLIKPNRVLLLDNGVKAKFDETGVKLSNDDTIPIKELVVDGLTIGNSQSKTFLDRQVLSDNGIIVVGFLFSLTKREIVGEIEVITKGYVQNRNINTLKVKIEAILKETITFLIERNNFSVLRLKEEFKERVARFTRMETLTNPKLYTLIEEIE